MVDACPLCSPRRRSFVTLAAWLAVMLLTAGPGFAATFTVDTTADAVDAMPGNGTCATAGAACSLRAAIQEANALAGADAITLPAGTYVLSVPGVGDNAALQGDLDVTADLTLTGAGAATTIVDGGGIDRVFDIRAGTVTFGGLTVRNGNVQGCGGGLASQTTFTLHDAVVTANTAQSGGGLCNEAHPPYTVVLTLDNVAVRSNMGTEGGGIANVSYGEVEFPFSYGTATVTTVNTVVADNHADDGGGIASIANLGVAAIHTNTTTIRDNVAIGDGGGVFLGGTLTIGFPITSIASLDARDSTISGNMATSGGGIDGLPAYLTASTVSGNHASLDGGGLRGCWTIDDSTISGNTSDRNGGGIAEPSDGCTLRGVTISDNTADADADGSGDGGGMSTTGRHVVDLRNTIIGRNVDMGSESPDCAGEIGSSGHNLLEQPSGCLIAGDPTGNVAGLDPKLGPLANNGGATLTHALLTGSPALDAGAGCNATDQRGSARPQGPACDIGAVEQLYAPTACGNGALDGGEACDDGNGRDGDCCDHLCQLESLGAPCSDGDPCTDDTCNGAGTCGHVANTAPCTDASVCTVNDVCGGGSCQPGGSLDCDDGNVCTAESCNAETGCRHDGLSGGACDDGNVCTTTDTCHSGYCYGTGTTGPCDDGDVCTISDHCAGATCVGGDPLICPGTCETCQGGACAVAPRGDCRGPTVINAAKLQLRDRENDKADSLQWTWRSNGGTSSHDFPYPGFPEYELCIFDTMAGAPSLVFGAQPRDGVCGARQCWKQTGRGFTYRDPAAAVGLTNVRLQASPSGTGGVKLSVKGKGTNLTLPTLPLHQDPHVIVELRARDGACWWSQLDTAKENSATGFTATGP